MKAFLSSLVILTCGISTGLYAETADSPWAVNDPAQTAAVDHQTINEVINYFGDIKRDYTSLDFDSMRGAGADYIASYLEYLQSLPVSQLNRDEQLAYWLNLRNAAVTYVLSTRNVPRRIDDERGTPEAPGEWWTQDFLTVEGHSLSLAKIEQEVLAENWSDSLFIYGLYDSSIGSPTLGEIAFTGATVHQQLEAAARKYINNDDNVDISRRGKVTLSEVYQWHKPLFGNSDAGVISHLMSYAEPELAAQLSEAEGIDEYDFNWSVAEHTTRTISFDSFDSGVGGGS